MKTIHNNIPFTLKGKQVNCTVEIYTRGGTKSPDLWIVTLEGKRRTPYWQRKNELSPTLNGLFKITYSPYIDKLVYNQKPLFFMNKNEPGQLLFSTPVILGLENGVAFSVIDDT